VALLAAIGPVASARARTVTVHLSRTPQVTLTVPAGWAAHVQRKALVLTRGPDRVLVSVCLLNREQRDMTGRHTAGVRDGQDVRNVDGVYVAPAAGGGCVTVAGGRAAGRMARQLHARLGPASRPRPSDATAEALARAARTRTLGQPRAQGTAVALPFGLDVRIDSAWQWDLPSGYFHQLQRFTRGSRSGEEEVVRSPDGGHSRSQGEPCWFSNPPPDEDDALEPRLELHEWDAPPRTATAWRVVYAPPAPQPDGSTLVTWTGFVADGQALVGPDGLLRSVRIVDHRQAHGRTVWRVVEVAFTAFPAQIAPVSPTPICST
jgi:hypothetical protein